MSLPREWNLQDSRGSLYCPSEPDPIGRIKYQSGGFIFSSTGGSINRPRGEGGSIGGIGTNINGSFGGNIAENFGSNIEGNFGEKKADKIDGNFVENFDGNFVNFDGNINPHAQAAHTAAPPTLKTSFDECGLPLAACSQPAAPSLLTECQQSCGSLFSVVSAPPVPLAELDVKQVENLNGMGMGLGMLPPGGNGGGLCVGLGALQMGGVGVGCGSAISSTLSSTSVDGPRRPHTLPINAPHCPATLSSSLSLSPPPPAASRTLHASLLQHQISEIEEDDNENLLTVSSITARPLIAKSREIRQTAANRHMAEKPSAKNTGGGGGLNHKTRKSGVSTVSRALRETSTSGKYAASSSRSSVSADPPDGGYGWFIVFGAFSVQFWVAGLVKSYGVLYVEIMETFPSSTATVASWIPAILSALCLVLAPLSSALCQRFSCRSVVFVGGLFCAFGLTLSYFATSLLHLLFTFGILTGIGGGLSTTPGIVIVSQYFDKHRALANGICVSGTAAGSFILPVLIKHLAEAFGFHGTILVLGGCMLHVCVSATLYKPLDEYVAKHHGDEEEEDDEESVKPLNDINPSTTGILTNSTYLDSCDEGSMSNKYIEHLFMEESKNRLNDYYTANKMAGSSVDKESDDEVKDTIGETTFIKPMKKVRSSGIMHSVEDLSTDSTWVYRKHSGTDSNRGSRRRRNAFANDEIISKIQAHLEKPLSPPPPPPPPPTAVIVASATDSASVVSPRGLSKSMEIPTPVSNLNEVKKVEIIDGHTSLKRHRGVIDGNGGANDRLNNDDDDDEDDDDEDEVLPRTCCERIKKYLDISLLKDPTFILMCLSVTLMSVGCPYMLYYLPAHVISIGYNKSEAGYLVAVSAVLDLIGRLGLGWLSDLQLFDRRKTYILCILGAGIAVLTIPSEHSLYLLGLSSAVYGLCLGSWYVLMPVLLADIFGTDRISSSYGLVRMFQSIGAISVPPLAGFLRDLSGSYQICFYCMGSCMVLGCVPLLVWALLEYRSRDLYDIRNDSEENSMAS